MAVARRRGRKAGGEKQWHLAMKAGREKEQKKQIKRDYNEGGTALNMAGTTINEFF